MRIKLRPSGLVQNVSIVTSLIQEVLIIIGMVSVIVLSVMPPWTPLISTSPEIVLPLPVPVTVK